MKRTAYVFIACLVLLGGTGVRSQGAMESLVPADTRAFLRSAPVGTVVNSVNTFLNTGMTAKQRQDFLKDILQFKKDTGINPLSVSSLRKTGIDTSLPFGFAFVKGKPGPEKMMVLLPVLNSKRFPLKFIQILKKTKKGKKKKDIYPVITRYKNNRIYQVQKDMFCAAIGSYFIMTSQGAMVRQAIDRSESGGSSLSTLNEYSSFTGKVNPKADFALYMNKVFLGEAFGKIQQGFMRRKQPHSPYNRRRGMNENSGSIIPAQYGGTRHYRGTPRYRGTPYGMREQRGPSPMEAVDYASMTLTLGRSKVVFSLGAQLNNSNPLFTALLDILKTGMGSFSLYSNSSFVYGHAALDLQKLDKLCPGPLPICGQYQKTKMELKREMGIDYNRDVLPAIRGSANVIMDTMNMTDMVIFVPYKSAARGRALFARVKRTMAKNMKRQKRYGSTAVGGKRGFWILDKQNKKMYAVQDNRGIYISNNVTSLKKALRYRTIAQSRGRSTLLKKLSGNVFLMAFVKKNPFVGGLLASKAPKKEMKEMSSSIGDIYVTGSKADNFLNIELDVTIKPSGR